MSCARCAGPARPASLEGPNHPSTPAPDPQTPAPNAPGSGELTCPACGGETPPQPQPDPATPAAPALGATEEARESRLRRLAQRQGLTLMKSRSAPGAPPCGTGEARYWLAITAAGGGRRRAQPLPEFPAGLSLDAVEDYLVYGSTRAEIMEYLRHTYGRGFIEKLIKHLPRSRAQEPSPGRPGTDSCD
jgi:hypothetical protein